MRKKKVTRGDVDNWLGSDCQAESMIEMLRDIANGDYTAEQLLKDVLAYKEE